MAKKAGVTRVAISKAENKVLQKVSTVTRFLKSQLHCSVHRSGFRTETKKVSIGKIMLSCPQRDTAHSYPVINWVQAGLFATAGEMTTTCMIRIIQAFCKIRW
ncbi:hypothetical protein ACLB1R_18815 [Escherichia coli]